MARLSIDPGLREDQGYEDWLAEMFGDESYDIGVEEQEDRNPYTGRQVTRLVGPEEQLHRVIRGFCMDDEDQAAFLRSQVQPD